MKIKEISKEIDNEILILFWQFTIKTLEELDIVSNQNLSVEMFLIRLMHIKSSKVKKDIIKKDNLSKLIETSDKGFDAKNDAVSQIKNISQEKKIKPEIQTSTKAEGKVLINSFDELINFCNEKKEINLKYELEKNVSLVSFNQNRIEISFNDNLDKNFVKDLSLRLFEWTGERWIITFSKAKGEISIKEKEKNKKFEQLQKAKDTELYKAMLEKFPDANLIDLILKKED